MHPPPRYGRARDALSRDALARADADGQPVGRRGQRADPARVVGARGVVREVEVEHEAVAVGAEVGALDRVEQVPAAAERGRATCRVGEREVDSAAVPLQPVQLEREAAAVELERGVAEAREAEDAVLARADVEDHGLDRNHGGEHSCRRVVVEVVDAPKRRALTVRERGLRMAREQLVATGAPDPPSLRWVGGRAYQAVEIDDAPPPVRERDQVPRPRPPSSSGVFATRPDGTRPSPLLRPTTRWSRGPTRAARAAGRGCHAATPACWTAATWSSPSTGARTAARSRPARSSAPPSNSTSRWP